ncbi:hypothetical protein A2368_03570 [Candidatus Collierbacteria bacterium RIFOXYB1_FULL_49_13]|uniref:Type II secretion system protein GspG C-terminal domain-containing protein n=1 Tax=Candidatus Collierbacteria bacterium RIFOXYB1_FULL_49_13 TaxID=1817728 RepID=A0A1F5FGV0_9BACT|nr:MAG: hypothetical protein A2368_03570 [Candidatus Collierbacteria bacterium RIFOXYB1_FULL_49_13]
MKLKFAVDRGFTLIELLIVIGVLGILASGLLAAVDPFEQLKKGRDSNLRNQVVELHNALIRYYATHGELPWCNSTGQACVLNSGTEVALDDLNAQGYFYSVDKIIADGELKGADGDEFIANLGAGNASKIFVRSEDDVHVSVCFAPDSKSLFMDTATKFDAAGVMVNATGEACDQTQKDPTSGIGTCYWCAK